MFPLHETNRRLLCRVIFLVLVPAPTLAVAAWCAARHLPGYAASYEDRLGAALGVRVELEGVSHPLPGKTVLHGVKLFDAEQGEEIATCDELSITHADDTLLISAEQAILKRDQFDRGWEALHARLRQPDTLPAKTRLLVRRVRIDVRGGYETLEKIDLTIQSGRSGVHASLAFGLFDTESDEPVRLDIVRNRQSTPPATQVELRTGPTALPCSLLSLSDEGLSALGPRCRFRGVVSMQQTRDGWNIQLTDQGPELPCVVLDIDLERLVTKQLPSKEQIPLYVLSGMADLWIKSTDKDRFGLELKNGRLIRAEGIIFAEQGRIGGSLIGALEQHLNIPPVYPKQFPDQQFKWLNAAFKLDETGLSVRGPSKGAGAVIVDRDGRPLLGQLRTPQPLTGLLNFLFPQDDSSAARAYLEAVLPRPALLR